MDDGILPPELRAASNAAGEETSRLLAAWPEEIRPRFEKHVTYFDLPFLFLPAFPRLKPSEIAPLGVFCRLFATSLFIQDPLVDGHAKANEVGVGAMSIMALQFDAYRALHGLLPPGARFWARLQSHIRAHVKACLDERAFRTGKRPWSDYTDVVALGIARDKHGVSKSVLAALVELSGEEQLLEPLSSALDHYNTASQIWDDLVDWKQDLADGSPSILLRRVFEDRPQVTDAAEIRRTSREIHYGGHALALLELALSSLDRAEEIRALAPDLPFYTAIGVIRGRCRTLHRDVARIVESNVRRAKERAPHTLEITLPAAKSRTEALALDALRFIVKQWRLGFGEAREITKHPRRLGLGNGDECVYGDVFQRALIADGLCDLCPELGGVVMPIIESECAYLASRRSTTGVGGWKYYPDLDEMPPDADDLGQVMQVFLRASHRDVLVGYCELPLSVLLSDNLRPDGSFPTWIVRKTEQSESDAMHAGLVLRLWGTEPDDAVVPNLLYALHLYDAGRFGETIECGMDWLEKRQHDDGTFSTRYYHGPFYGIYVCVRLFAARRRGSPLIRRALAALRDMQVDGGGFSFCAEGPNALHTALALLTFALAPDEARDPSDGARIERALSYLLEVRGDDGAFANEKFIYPLVGIHGSRTMTTLFVMKAAWAFRNAAGAP